TYSFKSKIAPVGFSKHKDHTIYALSNYKRDKMALVEIACISGKEERVVFTHDSVDVSEAGYSPLNHKLLFAGYETSHKKKHFLNDSTRRVFEHLERLLPQTQIQITSTDLAEQKCIVKTFTDVSSGTYYLYDLRSK